MHVKTIGHDDHPLQVAKMWLSLYEVTPLSLSSVERGSYSQMGISSKRANQDMKYFGESKCWIGTEAIPTEIDTYISEDVKSIVLLSLNKGKLKKFFRNQAKLTWNICTV